MGDFRMSAVFEGWSNSSIIIFIS